MRLSLLNVQGPSGVTEQKFSQPVDSPSDREHPFQVPVSGAALWHWVKESPPSALVKYLSRGDLASVLVAQLCPTLCHPVDCSPPGSSVHGILQARTLEWAALQADALLSEHRGSPGTLLPVVLNSGDL